MKQNSLITLAIVGMLCLAGQFFTIAAHPGSHDKNAFTPETIPWGPVTSTSVDCIQSDGIIQ